MPIIEEIGEILNKIGEFFGGFQDIGAFFTWIWESIVGLFS